MTYSPLFFWSIRIVIVSLFIYLCTYAAVAAELQIVHVNVDRLALQSARNAASIRFKINRSADVVVKFYDARNYRIAQQRAGHLSAGEHLVSWQGMDDTGRRLPPGAYYYVIEAADDEGQLVAHDLTDITGGERLQLQEVKYDPLKRRVTCFAPKRGRYFLRAGVSGSFMVKTLLNNEVLEEGYHEIPWDGFDASHLFSVANHPNLMLYGSGYQLSDNAILIGPMDGYQAAARASRWVFVTADTPKRIVKPVARADLDPGYLRDVERNRDVMLKLVLPAGLARNAQDIPIISGSTPIRVELSSEDAEIMESQRGEVVFFWNSELIYDNEVSYYPFTFNWVPPVIDGKIHLITGFVAGFSGNFALATIQVQLGEGDEVPQE